MKILNFFVIVFISFSVCASVAVVSVTRDLSYSDIFTYKSKLIGNSLVNKFSFEGAFDPSNKAEPEYFLVKIKTSGMDLNKMVKVVFSYKGENNPDFEQMTSNLVLKGRMNKVKFNFSKEMVQKNGRVDLWEIKIYEGSSLIASKRSVTNAWWREKGVKPQGKQPQSGSNEIDLNAL